MPTTTIQSTTETNHHSRTVPSTNTYILAHVSHNSLRPVYKLTSKSNIVYTPYTIDMEYMHRLGTKTSERTNTDEDKDIYTLRTLNMHQTRMLIFISPLDYHKISPTTPG